MLSVVFLGQLHLAQAVLEFVVEESCIIKHIVRILRTGPDWCTSSLSSRN